jgi:hypothetical protein
VKNIKPFNRLEITSSEFNFLQSTTQDEIKARLDDGTLTYGIVIPNSSTIADIGLGVGASGGAFGLFIDGSNNLRVGPLIVPSPSIHVAYDSNGERIEIPTGDVVVWKGGALTSPTTDAPQFTTDNISGFAGSTPFSTGRFQITDPDPLNTSALSDLTRFVFISYVPVAETEALPPNHESLNGSISGATTARLPITMLDQKEGIAYSHHRINGYRIFVAKSNQISVGADLVPVLAGALFPSPEDSAVATYIGKYTWSVGTGMSAATSSSDGTHQRPLLRVRGTVAAVVGDKGSPTTLPTAYAAGETRTVREHMAGVGTGTVTPVNVHGLAIGDITGGGEEPDNRTYHDQTLGDGVIDTAFTGSNNPVPASTAFQIAINNATSIIYDPAAAAFASPTGTPALVVDSPGNLSPSLKIVTVGIPTSTQSIYLGGRHLTEISPQTTISLTPFGYVPFGAGDAGTATAPSGYNIFVMAHPNVTTNPNTAVLGKAPVGTVLSADRLLLGSVGWDGTGLRQSVENNGTTPSDLRSFAVISKHEVSTKGMIDATTGILSAQHMENLASQNPDFGRGFDFWTYTRTAGQFESVDFIRANTTIGLNQTVGPVPAFGAIPAPMTTTPLYNVVPDTNLLLEANAYFGVRYRFLPDANALNVHATTNLGALKPNTNYVVSLQVRATAATKTEMAVSFTNPSGVTIYAPSKSLSFVRDNSYHRVTTMIKTNSTPNVLTTDAMLRLSFSKAGGFATFGMTEAGEISITSIHIVEGDFALGVYSVRSGYSEAIESYTGGFTESANVDSPNTNSPALVFASRGGLYRVRIETSFTVIPLGSGGGIVQPRFDGALVDGSADIVSNGYAPAWDMVRYFSPGNHSLAVSLTYQYPYWAIVSIVLYWVKYTVTPL